MKPLHLIVLLLFVTVATTAQPFNKIYKLPLEIYGSEYAVCKIPGSLISAYTTFDATNNYRKKILLVSVNEQGEVQWSKLYETVDAGLSISVESIVAVSDTEFIVIGDTSPNNDFPYKKHLIKFNKGGTVLWAETLNTSDGYSMMSLLSDNTLLIAFKSKDGGDEQFSLMKVDLDGTVLKTVKTNIENTMTAIEIHPFSGNANVVLNDFHILNIDNDLSTLNFQRKYFTSLGFAMNRAANGDYLYASAQAASFPSFTTVFRTNSQGTLRWAKNLESTMKSTNGLDIPFYVVGFHLIREDSEGNIECIANSEGGTEGSQYVKLTGSGEYLASRKINSHTNKIVSLENDEYFAMGMVETQPGNFHFAKHKLSDRYECDEDFLFSITEGSDHKIEVDDDIAFSSIDVLAEPTTIQSAEVDLTFISQCDLESKPDVVLGMAELKNNTALYPNPNGGEFNIQMQSGVYGTVNILLYDLAGRAVFSSAYLKSDFTFNQTIDTEHLAPGIYVAKVSIGSYSRVIKIGIN